MSLLALRSVSKFYGPAAAVDGVTLDIEKGSRTAIVGASGSGKTTLLRLIAGFDMPASGTIALDGETIAGDGRRVPAHLRSIGYVTQDGTLFPHLTIAENVAFGMRVTSASERQTRIGELLEMTGLDPAVATRRPDQLSGGQQQRVALARALAQRPRLMLLDEPFSALDAGLRATTRRAVMDVLSKAAVTSILVTHDHEEALSSANRIAVMIAGRLAQYGPPSEVYWRPSTPGVARLLGETILLPAQIEGSIARTPLGALPVTGTAARKGSALVLLRPEQIVIAKGTSCGLQARVRDVEFTGGRSRITLDMTADQPGAEIALWHSGPATPSPGAAVHLTIEGSAHAFPANGGQ